MVEVVVLVVVVEVDEAVLVVACPRSSLLHISIRPISLRSHAQCLSGLHTQIRVDSLKPHEDLSIPVKYDDNVERMRRLARDDQILTRR